MSWVQLWTCAGAQLLLRTLRWLGGGGRRAEHETGAAPGLSANRTLSSSLRVALQLGAERVAPLAVPNGSDRRRADQRAAHGYIRFSKRSCHIVDGATDQVALRCHLPLRRKRETQMTVM